MVSVELSLHSLLAACFCAEVNESTSSQMESLILTDGTNNQKQRTLQYKKNPLMEFLQNITLWGRARVRSTATTYWGS